MENLDIFYDFHGFTRDECEQNPMLVATRARALCRKAEKAAREQMAHYVCVTENAQSCTHGWAEGWLEHWRQVFDKVEESRDAAAKHHSAALRGDSNAAWLCAEYARLACEAMRS